MKAMLLTALLMGPMSAPGGPPVRPGLWINMGSSLSMTIPAGDVLEDTSRCNFLGSARVYVKGFPVRFKWNRDRDLEGFGEVLFDGMTVQNFSNTSIVFDARIIRGC